MFWILFNTQTDRLIAQGAKGEWFETPDWTSAMRFVSTASIRHALQTIESEDTIECMLCVGNVRALVGDSR